MNWELAATRWLNKGTLSVNVNTNGDGSVVAVGPVNEVIAPGNVLLPLETTSA